MEYLTALRKIIENGEEELNKRTGIKTKRIFGLSLTYKGGMFTSRNVNPGISAAELAWMLSGEKKTEWMKRYCSIWNKFEDSDGIIETAYGDRWRNAFGRDQISGLINLLNKDISSRQGLILSWDPRTDGLENQGKYKNVPCPFAFSVFICNHAIRLVVYQRSADFIAGVPYDMITYYMLGQAIGKELNVPMASVDILFGDAHIYETHYEIASKTINSKYQENSLNLQTPSITDILKNKDKFVKDNWKIWDGSFEINEKVEVAQ